MTTRTRGPADSEVTCPLTATWQVSADNETPALTDVEVLAGEQGVLAGIRDGSLIAVHSTVHPDTGTRSANRLEPAW